MEYGFHQVISQKKEVRDEEIDERIRRFFTVSPNTTSEENRLEEMASALAVEFLSSKNTNSDIKLNDLAEKFKNTEIPAHPINESDYINALAQDIVAHAIRTSSPRFIGHMTSALPSFMRPLTKILIAMNQNMVKVETAKSLTFYERQGLAMFHRLAFGFPEDFYKTHVQRPGSTLGILTSGGTVANTTALWCARNLVLGPEGGFKGIEQEGLPSALKHYGYDGGVIIGSSLMHYSFEKAAALLGLGASSLIRIPIDNKNRVDLAKLRDAIEESRARNRVIIAIVGVAGSTDLGSIDPISEMGKVARDENIHFHVDAAWGGAFLLSKCFRSKLDGIELADTVTIDGHKQLYLPMGQGMLLLRDIEMANLIEKQANYILRPGSLDLGKRSLEGSRPAAVILLHAALNLFGQKGYEYLLGEAIRKAGYMVQTISNRPEFELIASPDLNIVVYRFLPPAHRKKAAQGLLDESDNAEINEINKRIQQEQRKAGNGFISRTTLSLDGRKFTIPIIGLRAVIANPLTTETDIDAVLDEQADIAASLIEDQANRDEK